MRKTRIVRLLFFTTLFLCGQNAYGINKEFGFIEKTIVVGESVDIDPGEYFRNREVIWRSYLIPGYNPNYYYIDFDKTAFIAEQNDGNRDYGKGKLKAIKVGDYDVTCPMGMYEYYDKNRKTKVQGSRDYVTFKIHVLSDNVTLEAKNYTREYGADNPEFDFETTSGTLKSGRPTISCSADKTSPVGTYNIVITKGGVGNTDVTLVNGKLTITKAPLEINGGDYVKKQGDENPTFTPIYTGFVNGETETVLTRPVSISTTATKSSPVGSYPVKVSGAAAQNYDITYTNGTLNIVDKTLDVVIGGFSYTINATRGTAELTAAPNNCKGDVVLPSKVSYTEKGKTIRYPLKSIGNGAFKGRTKLRTIVIPEGVTSIGDEAFYGCEGLKGVTIPSTISPKADNSAMLGENTFMNCPGLKKIVSYITDPRDSKSSFNYGQTLNDKSIWLYVPAGTESAYKEEWLFQRVYALNTDKIAIGDYYYTLNNKNRTAEICGINEILYSWSSLDYCSIDEMQIPSKITYNNYTYKVTSINLNLGLRYKFGSINIPEGITDIAFFIIAPRESSIVSMAIPNSAKNLNIGNGEPVKVESIHIKDMKTWCNLTLPYNYKTSPWDLGAKLYLNGKEVKGEVVIPWGVKAIPNYCFQGYKSLTSVQIPSTVTSIGYHAFKGTGLTSVKLPNSITELSGAFYKCEDLKSVVFVEGTQLKKIGTYAFCGCSALTNVNIPNGVTDIYGEAFADCLNLTAVTIPSSVTRIGWGAFSNSVTKVYITDLDAFSKIQTEGNGRLSKPFTNGYHLYLNGDLVTEVDIPEGVSEISAVYVDILDIEKVTIPASVADWKAGFRRSSVKQIISNAPTPPNIEPIQFASTEQVAEVRAASEESEYCWPFEATDKNSSNMIVPFGSGEIYKANEFTGQFQISVGNSVQTSDGYTYKYNGETMEIKKAPEELAGDVIIPDETPQIGGKTYAVTSIGERAFYGREQMTSVTIPASIKSIDDEAFSSCWGYDGTGLAHVYFEEGSLLESIGSCAFETCAMLETINIPSCVSSIGEYAFVNCETLSSTINIPAGIGKIEMGAFKYCSELTDVTIPSSVTSILGAAFSGCEKLSAIEIPIGVKDIGQEAFSDCISLTEIVIPEGVEHIGSEAFRNCENLRSVSIPSTIKMSLDNDTPMCYETGPNAFDGCSNLMEITSYIKNPQTGPNDSFTAEQKESATLIVPYGSIASYKEYWGFKNIKGSVIPGDANGDGKVNMTDVNVVKDYIITGKTEGFYFNNADANGDNVVNAADIVKIINIIEKQ